MRTVRLAPREAKDVEWAIDGMASSVDAAPDDLDYTAADLPRLTDGILTISSSAGAEEDLRYRLVDQLRDMINDEGEQRAERLKVLARVNRKIWGAAWPYEVSR